MTVGGSRTDGPTITDKIDRIKVLLEQETKLWELKEAVRKDFCTNRVSSSPSDAPIETDEQEVTRLVNGNVLSKEVQNRVYLLCKSLSRALQTGGPPLEESPEPLEYVFRARLQWEKSLKEELMSIARERGEALVAKGPGVGGALYSQQQGGASPQPGATPNAPMRFLFDSEDLLDAVSHIDSANMSGAPNVPRVWGLVRLQLETPDLNMLQSIFSELHPRYRQLGLDDKVPEADLNDCCTGEGPSFVSQRIALGRKVLDKGFILDARKFARFGIPACLRPGLWRILLGLTKDSDASEKAYYGRLKDEARKVKLVTDDLFRMDVEHMSDDHRYFPFEEVLEGVLQAFSRDPWVRHNSAVLVHKPLVGQWGEGQSDKAVPPCAVLPFRGLVNYAAPVCFMYEAPEPAYFVVRAMWAQMWCRLNALRSHDCHLIHVCKTFEDLLVRYHPRLFFHLTNRVGVSPLQLVMPWLQFGFVSLIEPDQVLLLWDRILGYCDPSAESGGAGLLLLPVLAAAILVFRAQTLLAATEISEVQDALADGSRLKVMPLLQWFLFPYEDPPQSEEGSQGSSGGGGAAASSGGTGRKGSGGGKRGATGGGQKA